MANIGPHLLGRIPSPPDSRDFKLAAFLGASPLDIALAKLRASKGVPSGVKTWAKTITTYLQSLPPPPPQPGPKPPDPKPDSADVIWTDPDTGLDQGDTPHCVGFGWAHWGNTAPVEDHFKNSDGHAVYYECKVIDEEPGEENGSYVRSGAKAMQNRARLSVYAFASSVEEIKQFVRQKGSVVVGTIWTNAMFEPDSKGFVKPTGQSAGGHCYLLVGDLPSEGAFLFQNSWGAGWGLNGRFKMKYQDFDHILRQDGEACAVVELPI